MNKTLKTSLVALGLLAFGFVITSSVNAQTSTWDVEHAVNGDVYLTVDAWQLTIWVSGATVNLWTWNAGETIAWQFNPDSFYVSDLKWAASGYYTTIQVTDLTGDVNGVEKVIPKENVSFKKGQTTSPHTITGNNNEHVVFDSHVSDYYVLTGTVTYIKRDTDLGGILWVYGDDPWVQVTIPAYTPATTYHGTITYTLYENQ